MAFRISYHEVAAKATHEVPREKLARAIERLSISYREGKPTAGHRSREGRAAYLVHVMPAHVCDERRLFWMRLEDAIARPTLRVLALGAGPGTEAVALADAWAHLSSRDGKAPGELLHVDRVDLVADWDESFAALRDASERALRTLDPGLGTSWRWDAPARSLACDLTASLARRAPRARPRSRSRPRANLLSELEPRSTPVLPAGFVANLESLARAAKQGASAVFLDRGPRARRRPAGALRPRDARARPPGRGRGPLRARDALRVALSRATPSLSTRRSACRRPRSRTNRSSPRAPSGGASAGVSQPERGSPGCRRPRERLACLRSPGPGDRAARPPGDSCSSPTRSAVDRRRR